MTEKPSCPVCGGDIFAFEGMNDETGKIEVLLRCEDEDYALEISTELTEEDIANIHEVGKPMRKEMIIRLVSRDDDPNENE